MDGVHQCGHGGLGLSLCCVRVACIVAIDHSGSFVGGLEHYAITWW